MINVSTRVSAIRRHPGAALVTLLLVVSTVVAPAFAAERRGEIGFDVGRTNLSSDYTDDTAAAFGLRGGYHFNKWFELEGQFSALTADEPGADANLSTMFINGVVNFQPRPTIRPYVLVGVGRANLEFDFGFATVDDHGEAYQVAAGSRFLISKEGRLAARLEASRLRERTFDQSSDYTNVMTGLSWRIGRRT